MNAAYTPLLEKRIILLEEKDFDLEAWKTGTVLLLGRAFGEDNSYGREINNLKVDYSSWSLRDATSDYNPREACKRAGQEILELAVAELQLAHEQEKTAPDITEELADANTELADAIAKKDEETVRKLLNKENKGQLVNLLTKLLLK